MLSPRIRISQRDLTHMNICKTMALSQVPQAQASGPGFLIFHLHKVQGSFPSFWTCFLMDSHCRILDCSPQQGRASPESPLTTPSPGRLMEGICYQPGSPPRVWICPWTAAPLTPFCPCLFPRLAVGRSKDTFQSGLFACCLE